MQIEINPNIQIPNTKQYTNYNSQITNNKQTANYKKYLLSWNLFGFLDLEFVYCLVFGN